MIRSLLIDDEKRSLETLELMLKKYCPSVEIVGLARSAAEAGQLIVHTQPNLLFLDIEMPHENGFDFLQKIGVDSFEVIFTTAYDQYAIKAFKFSALDYLLKPINIDELIAAVARAERRIKESKNSENLSNMLSNLRSTEMRSNKLAVPYNHGTIFLPVHGIIHCEADGSYTKIFTSDQSSIMASKHLKEFEYLLSDHNFFRVHRSHLVNLDHIRRYTSGASSYVVMKDGTEIPLSRRKKEAFIRLFKEQ